MKEVKPLLVLNKAALKGRIVIGTVKRDLHDVGKNLVSMMLEGAGFEVVDLGVDVSAEKFVTIARDNKTDILAMSALLTTAITSMKKTIESFMAIGLRSEVRIMIGDVPLHLFLQGLSGYSYAFLQLADYPSQVEHLLTVIAQVEKERLWPIVVKSPAKLICHGKHAVSEEDFEQYLDDLFRTIAPGDTIILEIGDNIVPAAIFDRAELVGRMIQEKGTCPITV